MLMPIVTVHKPKMLVAARDSSNGAGSGEEPISIQEKSFRFEPRSVVECHMFVPSDLRFRAWQFNRDLKVPGPFVRR